MRWRDWSLPVKLSAVTLIPIIIALVLGVTTIAGQVGKSDGYQRVDRLVTLSSDVRTLLADLQRERTQAAAVLTAGTVGGTPALTSARTDVDRAVAPFADASQRAVALDSAIAAPVRDTSTALAKLAGLRQQAAAGQLDPVQAITGYTEITTALLNLDTSLAAGVTDDTIGGAPGALHDLQVAGEQVSLSQALIDYGIGRGNLAPTELVLARAAQVRLGDRLDDFRAAATAQQRADFAATVPGARFDARDALANGVLQASDTPTQQSLRQLSGQQWDDASTAVLTGIDQVAGRVGQQIQATSARLVDSSSSGAGVLAVLLFGALVLAAAVVFLITRQLLRSLRILRASALDVAEQQLPAAVRNIQEGRTQGTDVRPVPITVNDEIGEVARAFDAVHHQALRLATEQAAMRTGYGSVFVNLSRRSQSLVQRQLQLIERLERDEEDADQLATLFQLDHLATRMRRNNENLMVLSGSEPSRRSGQPVSTTDVLRAAVSEIEQYQRVVVQPPPVARIVGYAASDLMRLLAELLDNATAFSAPETHVTMATRLADDGSLSVDILDKGIGMNEAEVAEANTRLTEAGSVDLATSRRMGLFVVGRLASRHRVGVSLFGGRDIVGVRATVTVPAELVMAPPAPEAAKPHQRPPVAGGIGTPGALPRRQRTVNGATRPGIAVPPQGDRRSSGDPTVVNGHAPVVRPPSDLEVSGTALFSPIKSDDPAAPPSWPGLTASPLVPQQLPTRPTAPVEPPKPPTSPKAPEAPEALKPPTTPPVVDDGDLPRGKALFTANGTALTEWWNQAAGSLPQRATPPVVPPPTEAETTSETTPIFDEMLSAWFRSSAPVPAKPAVAEEKADGKAPEEAAAEASAEGETKALTGWDFASDENWRTVQAVTQAQPPSTLTQAGLPIRRRGEQLMPGSAAPAEPATPVGESPAVAEWPTRDPSEMRGRLSSFQQGVSRGRKATKEQAEATEATEATVTEKPAGKVSEKASEKTADKPAESAAKVADKASEGPVDKASDEVTGVTGDIGVEAASEAAEAPKAAETQPEKAPEAAPEATAAALEPSPVLPQRVTKTDSPVPSAPAPVQEPVSIPASELGATAEWVFGSDESWRTVQAASQPAPSTYTPAGLPRRRRGEQLLPGSAAPPVAPPGPRPERDAHDVRGRLSSFQQGIQRGRHRTAQSTEGNQETLEGE
ncbi:MAG: histidine kinaselike ATPase containing nitrate/nitrite sensor domain [Amycolatopsis sp.]|nr:histidine kinaselike ATPase containing nitrate/nitrite sensor domain [Amycolatopsis sp.]